MQPTFVTPATDADILPSQLDSVVVFREGATCKRILQIEAGAGPCLHVGDLPLSVLPGSLRARVRSGDGQIVQVDDQLIAQTVELADLAEQQQAWQRAHVAHATLEGQRERLKDELEQFQKLTPIAFAQPKGDAPRPAPLQATLDLALFTEAEIAQRRHRLRVLEVSIAEAAQTLLDCQRELAQMSSAQHTERTRIRRVARVWLRCAITQPLEIEVEYHVPGARWVPSYALTLKKGLASGELQMKAMVVQHSGEDWHNVKLSLSTASLNLRVDMPELKALKIGREQPMPARSGWREPPAGLDTLFADYDEALAAAATKPKRLAKPTRAVPISAAAPLAKKQARPSPQPMAYGAAPSVPMPAAAPLPPPAASFGASAEMRRAGGGVMPPDASLGGSWPDAQPPEELDELESAPEASLLATNLLDYTALALAGVEDKHHRGRLVPSESRDAENDGDREQLQAFVRRVRRDSESVRSLPVPTNCQLIAATQTFDYRYDCSDRVDIVSDGRWSLVSVMQCAVDLQPYYVCVPSVEPHVYRTVKLRNRSAHALLPGPVDVSVGDAFVLTSRLPALGRESTATHELGLGVEEAIKVARNTQFSESTAGFLGGSSMLSHAISIDVVNRLPSPIELEVRERVPVADSAEKDMKVEETLSEPPWQRVDTPIDGVVVQGARRWQISLGAGKTAKLRAHYAVRIPTGRSLVGGNRRS